MERTVYGIFDSQGAARAAVDDLVREGVPAEVIDVQLQRDALAPEDLPQPATASRRYVKIGVPLVVLVGGGAGALVSGWTGALLGVLVAMIFGFIAAALSGSIEAKKEIAALEPEVEDGRTMLVVDVTDRESALDYERFLRRHGAVRVGSS